MVTVKVGSLPAPHRRPTDVWRTPLSGALGLVLVRAPAGGAGMELLADQTVDQREEGYILSRYEATLGNYLPR